MPSDFLWKITFFIIFRPCDAWIQGRIFIPSLSPSRAKIQTLTVITFILLFIFALNIDTGTFLWYNPWCCRFRLHKIQIGVSPSGKAQDFDSSIRWFKSSYPCQQKTHFCLPTKVRFLNDVCLWQMMLGNAQWWRLREWCVPCGTFYGKHRIIAKRSGATSFWAKRKASYRRRRYIIWQTNSYVIQYL